MIADRMFLLAAVVFSAGCGPAVVGSPGGARSGTARVMTGPELDQPAAANALDLIRMLRPQFLRPAGPARADSPAVYIDGTLSYVAALRHVEKHLIVEIRYLTPAEASFRLGPGHVGGAILVTTDRRRVARSDAPGVSRSPLSVRGLA